MTEIHYEHEFDEHADEREEEAARVLSGETEIPAPKLLGFYDRLRQRIVQAVERRGNKLSTDAVRALMLVPDVFMLLVRLSLDKDVPGKTRALIGGALAYFILPFDLLPEAILGGVGFMDDLILAVAVLSQAFGGELEPYARRHWSGSEDLQKVLTDLSAAAHSLLGDTLYQRLQRLLGRRGVKM